MVVLACAVLGALSALPSWVAGPAVWAVLAWALLRALPAMRDDVRRWMPVRVGRHGGVRLRKKSLGIPSRKFRGDAL